MNPLLSVAHCDPNVKSKNEEVPIQLTSDVKIMKTLIEHGAQITTDVVFELISMHNTDSQITELFKLSIRKGTILRNPNDLNSDGYTALHLACKADSFPIVKYLLSVAHCNPNIQSNIDEVPLQMTTNPEIIKDLIRYGAKTSIMYKSHKKLWEQLNHSNLQSRCLLLEIPQLEKVPLLQRSRERKGLLFNFFLFLLEKSLELMKRRLE